MIAAERHGAARARAGARGLSAALVVVALAVAGVLAGPAARAAEPLALDGRLTDQAGVLSPAEEERLEERLADLARAEGVPELYVVYVDAFESPSDPSAWVGSVASEALLGRDQYLLAISTDQRGMIMSYADDGPLSPTRVDEIQEQIASAHLVDDEWAEAIDLAIDEFERRPFPWWGWALIVAGGALAVFLLVRAVAWARAAIARRRELAHLEGRKERAARELVRADAALRDSAQELDFVSAEFGDEATMRFSAVTAEARATLTRAFETQHLLEDTTEDSATDTRRMTDEIIADCAAVHRMLREKKGDLAALRDLARNAPQSLERLTAARERARATLTEAERRLDDLRAAYSAADVVLVADVPEQMRERLAAVDAALRDLASAARSGRGGAITRSIRAAEGELAEVAELREDIEERARELDARSPSVASSPSSASQAAGAAPLATASPAAGTATDDDPAMQRAKRLLQRAKDLADALERDRPGDAGVTARRLQRVREAIADAESAEGSGPAEVERLARTAVDRAEFARSFATGRSTPYTRSSARSISSSPVDEARIGKAIGGGVVGAIGGGLIGGVRADAPGAMAGIAVGLVLGAISGAFGRGSGGSSSSGWSSSRRRSSSFGGSGGSRRSSAGRRSGSRRSSSGRRF